MYNQPRPLRPAKPWQSVNYLQTSREDLGFDAARWSERKPKEFADAGLGVHDTGFDADHYVPMSQPLTPQAIKALALLDDEHRNEDFAEQKEQSQDGTSSNAHLPFVLDVYEPPPVNRPKSVATKSHADDVLLAAYAKDKKAAPTDDLATQVKDTVDTHNASEVNALSEPLNAEETATDAQYAADVDVDVQDANIADATEQAPASAADESEAELAGADAQDLTANEVEQALGTESEPTDAQKEEPQPKTELAAEPEPSAEPEPVAVQGGIAPEEVAQREAEQFERGMAQGLAQGIAQGMEQGTRETREAMTQEVADQCALLAKVTQEVQTLMGDPKQFFEPLKRLSLHLAEQLVRGELSASSKTIERLVQHCLDEVSHPLQEGVVVELNPEDKKRLQAQGGDFLEGLRLEAVAELKPGSVRVFANDMVVEDLVEHRLHALARGLLSDVPSWQNKSALAKQETDKHSTEHDDDLA